MIDYQSGKVLAEANADKKLAPASLTKIMSSYIVGQALKSGKIYQQEQVNIDQDAWPNHHPILLGSSLIVLKPGDKVTVADFNKGIVIKSGNDASIALANHLAENQNFFVKLMNQYAVILGLKNTNFLTVHGLNTKGQYSTARDIAILSQALIHDVPYEYSLNKEKEFNYHHIKQQNKNSLLWSKNLTVDGVKTGYTSNTGHNLVASAIHHSMRLISVVLGAPTDCIKFSESKKLLNWGFCFYKTIIPLIQNCPFTQYSVLFGEYREINLGITQDIAITLPKGQIKNIAISFTIFSSDYLTAPLSKNKIVGTINFVINNRIFEQYPLVVMEELKQGILLYLLWDWIKLNIDKCSSMIF